VRERRGSYSGFCCRLYPFICWIIIKEGPGNFSGGRRPHWVNHVNLCLSCIMCLLWFLFLHLFYFITPRSCFSNRTLCTKFIRDNYDRISGVVCPYTPEELRKSTLQLRNKQ
jgi:hypothetical protein